VSAKLHSIAGQATWTPEQLDDVAKQARELAEMSDHITIIAIRRTTFENRDPSVDYRFGTQIRHANIAHDASPVTCAEAIGCMQVITREMMDKSWNPDD
jgi:hypothetical protein